MLAEKCKPAFPLVIVRRFTMAYRQTKVVLLLPIVQVLKAICFPTDQFLEVATWFWVILFLLVRWGLFQACMPRVQFMRTRFLIQPRIKMPITKVFPVVLFYYPHI